MKIKFVGGTERENEIYKKFLTEEYDVVDIYINCDKYINSVDISNIELKLTPLLVR